MGRKTKEILQTGFPKKLFRQLTVRYKGRNLSRPLHTVHGHFSLRNIRGAKFPGRQTAATSLCALLQAKSLSPSSWSPEVIDRLLLQGDKLHTTRLRDLDKLKTGNGDLISEELPTNFTSGHREFTVKMEKLKLPRLERQLEKTVTKRHTERRRQMIRDGLIRNQDGCLLTSGKDTVALFTDAVYYYFFHPCIRNAKRLTSACNNAVLLKFRDLDHVTDFLLEKFVRPEAQLSCALVDVEIRFDIWTNLSFARSLLWV